MARIVIDKDRTCFIDGEDDIKFLRALDNELSFFIEGAQFSSAFKRKVWDGRQRILTRNLTFPYGLLERVSNFYLSKNKSVEIVNKLQKLSVAKSLDIYSNLEKINRVPFPYQEDVLETVKHHDCGIIRSCTGSGKTLMAAMMTAYFNKPTMILVIGKDLLHQLHRFFSSIFDDKIGIIGDGICDIRDINIASVWSVAQALGLKKDKLVIEAEDDGEKSLTTDKYIKILEMLKFVKFIGADECHMTAAPVFQEIAKNINPEYIFGFSASPFRDDGKDLLIESIFGSIVVNISASRLIREGYLVRPNIKFLTVQAQKLPKNYQSIYKSYIIENPIRNDMIIKSAKKMVESGYKPLILYSKLKHGQIIYDKISKEMNVTLLSGKDETDVRFQAKDDIESGKIDCVVASTILDIGIDWPCLSGLVIAGSGKSTVRAIQRIGRVMRAYEKDGVKKANAAVVDFYDQAHFLKQHSKIRYRVYSTEEEYNISWPG